MPTTAYRTNDTDLTVTVSLAGTNALAGDTVQLYNGTTALGLAHVLTSTQLPPSSTLLPYTTLFRSTTYDITAKITDTAGNQSAASNTFTVIEDTTAPNARSVEDTTEVESQSNVEFTSVDRTKDTDLTVTVSLAGTNALAGDTVQLYNGTTALPLAHVLTSVYITADAVDLHLHSFPTRRSSDLTAKITDTAGNQSAASNTFTVIEDTTAPNAPAITAVNDDVSPVTGNLTSGDRTNDTDLTVTVSLAGTNALAGDTVQLYNGTTALGLAHVLTSAEITAGSVDLQTGTLSNGTTYDITAKITDTAGNQSAASNTFTLFLHAALPISPAITAVNDDVS